jgi:hypothetical protein
VPPPEYGTEAVPAPGGLAPIAGDSTGAASTSRTVSLSAAPAVGTVAALGGMKTRIGVLYLLTCGGAGLALLLSLLWRVKGVR